MDQKFIYSNFFGTPKFFLTLNFFGPKIFSDPKFIGEKKFWINIFLPKIYADSNFFGTPNLFLTQIFFGPKIFLNPKFFQTKTFSDPQIFQNQNFPSLSDSLVKPTYKTRLRSKVFSLESLWVWVKSLVWWVYSNQTK